MMITEFGPGTMEELAASMQWHCLLALKTRLPSTTCLSCIISATENVPGLSVVAAFNRRTQQCEENKGGRVQHTTDNFI